MHPEGLGDDIIVERNAGLTVYRRSDFPADDVTAALQRPGELIKTSPRAETLRVGAWIVKRSRSTGPLTTAKLTLSRSKCQNAWVAGRFLERRGVSVPRVYAYVERGVAGSMKQFAMVSEYLYGCLDVEHYADQNIATKASSRRAREYLSALAEAVNRLCSYKAYHRDLAGKNILTRDGQLFYFVDLDAVEIEHGYGERERLKNHIQLYDSFLDRWNDDVLEPFIAQMLPVQNGLAAWMDRVRAGQKIRRARTVAAWKKEGKL